MLHALLNLVVTRPELLADHAEAYADLLSEQVHLATTAWKQRLSLYAAALCSGVVATVLAGVAVMLWASLPLLAVGAGWALAGLPLLGLALASLCLYRARSVAPSRAGAELRQQFKADLDLLREVLAR